MRILITGKGSSGSWQCRGVQLGGQVGTVKARASLDDFKKADLVVAVKRITPGFIRAIGESGTPWIWDLVDFYPQPQCSTWTMAVAVKWVRRKIKQFRPDGVIWPNACMQGDCDLPGQVIYHHARQAPVNPIREKVAVVGYQGSEKYLGVWRAAIEAECARRGLLFKVNIPLDEMDVVVAFRDGVHNGDVQRRWKSNVKMANAHGTGTPFVGQPDNAYRETQTGLECWVQSRSNLSQSFDKLEPYETRLEIHKRFIDNTIKLESVGDQLQGYAETLLRD